MNFALLHCDPNPAFQPIGEVHVLYVYMIPLFISSELTLTKVQALAIRAASMKRKNIL